MRFHWFSQFSQTNLPDESRSAHSSWVTAPNKYAVPEQVQKDYGMYIKLMQQADGLGWDSLLLNEHHQTWGAMDPSPNLIAAILAQTTENAAIALCGNSLALYNPPVRVAEEMAMLDVLSGGRLIAGMVFGIPMDSTFVYGVPPVEIRERFHEARDLIVKAWNSDEPFAFNGEYNKLRYVNAWPRPFQEQIPIWIPGSGSVETWEVVNEHDYCYGYLSFGGRQNSESIVKGFWDYTEANGGNMNPYRMAYTQTICCAETDAEAEKLYADALRYGNEHGAVAPEFGAPPGYNSQDSMRVGFERAKTGLPPEIKAKAARGELSFWELDELGYIVAGSPERVEQRLRELVTDLRIGQLITTMHMGNLSEETSAMNTELFGTRVIPKMRDIWADYEDKWTPKVSQERVAAKFPGVA